MSLGTAPERGLKDLGADPPLQMAYWPGRSDRLVVVFSGVGNDPHIHPPFEFFNAATERGENHALFVSDKSRSWLNGPGVADQITRTVGRLRAETGATELHLIGNSMGATMALHLKDQLQATSVLAFVPQYSIAPGVVPEETRWMRFRKQIKDLPYERVCLPVTDGQLVIILHGGSSDELAHALRFPKTRGVRHFILPDFGHTLARHLKRQGQLYPLISAVLAGRPYKLRRLLERQGGLFRDAYEKRNR